MARPQNTQARERILNTAYDLIHARGFRAVSMEQVASAAGIKKANLFHYYASKDELGAAVFDLATRYLRERIECKFTCSCDPVECIDAMFRDSAKWMKDSSCSGGCFVGNLGQELADADEAWRGRVAGFIDYWVASLTKMFEAAKKRGQFDAAFKPQAAAEAVMSLFEGAVLLGKVRRRAQTLESARRMAVDYLRSHQRR